MAGAARRSARQAASSASAAHRGHPRGHPQPRPPVTDAQVPDAPVPDAPVPDPPIPGHHLKRYLRDHGLPGRADALDAELARISTLSAADRAAVDAACEARYLTVLATDPRPAVIRVAKHAIDSGDCPGWYAFG